MISRTNRIFLAAALLLFVQASPAAAQEGAGLGEFGERLELSPEQSEQLRPVLRAYFQGQRAILEKYGLDIRNRADDGESSSAESMRELGEELRKNNDWLQGQLAGFLSDAQMQEWERLREERRERFTDRMLVRQLEEMAVELGLTEDQLERMTPIYLDHVKTQLAIMQEHGMESGGWSQGRRPGFRTLRQLRRDTAEVRQATIQRLAPILSSEQLKQYEAIQDEQRREMRERRQ